MLHIENLAIHRGTYRIFLPRLSLARGEVAAITGASGCGKSTLLEMIGLILRPERLDRYELTSDEDDGDAPLDIAALLRQPFGSLPELVALQASQRPRHTALAMDGRSLDYAALRLGMDRVALRLQRQGLGPGDVVAICAGSSPEYVLAFLGALRDAGNSDA